MTQNRMETDSLGEIAVPGDKLWGAQTQRSLENFAIGQDVMDPDLIYGLALVKKVAAKVNQSLGRLDENIAQGIITAAEEVLEGRHQEQFPLKVWQTGSGTQSNMNVNEVIANRASQILGGELGRKKPVHPNDHVNLGQSSNDSFPTAMHIAIVKAIKERMQPALGYTRRVLQAKIKEFDGVVKSGRTHLMDATPLTVSQELSSYDAQLAFCEQAIQESLETLFDIAQGGTAVGTGLNTPQKFAETFAATLAQESTWPFKTADNKFMALAAHDAVLKASGSLRQLATVGFKIANDLRWLASGPRCGLGEYILPANEPGSSIMPGKVNPTQCEALTMVCAQVMGLDQAIAFAASQGQLQLNTFKPMMVHNVLLEIRLLSDALESFTKNCLEGLEIDRERMSHLLQQSLMLVTALTPKIGYDRAAAIAKFAHENGVTLKEAAGQLGHLSAEEFEHAIQPEAMTQPSGD
ncbi:class II fumarate hydratase [Pseudobacteriovorax antillogorgiicola]|uniref:Fumarate hydratase class II n=1 Tax=Pseudobacteriovorax antillogorgiicola TaxID=1513793 RepID=A0A1Y6CMS3_9BACT|nr:class II fumarate hydratase [Pseudobacteriovorax antillogorgiicola]TCS47565.1 fumarase class II [Pseudobacteriovorax antillogorgiicola]SMF60510.1 fumarase, class II [Pseudobacteriovorax antillogorgiicola]